MKIIPIQNVSLHNISGCFQEFTTLEYFKVEGDAVQSIGFELRSHDGDLLSFDNGTVQITLCFKKSI